MLNNAIENIAPESLLIEQHFAKNSNLVPFLDTIEGLALKVGAEAETTSVEVSSDKMNLILGLKAEGTFDSVYSFVKLLENSPYHMEFSYLDISKVSGQVGVEFPIWEAKFIMKLINFTN